VRFGVKPADDPDIVATLPVVDRELGVTTPNGQFWHRYNHDGYGETPDGGPFPGPGNTGRLWPLFAGKRGEYELARGGAGARDAARARLRAIAATGNDGYMLPEQVWDDHARRANPASRPARARSPPLRSAGRTRSSCGSPGQSTPAARSNARASSPAATPGPAAEAPRTRGRPRSLGGQLKAL
jgi:GH15 family glucan-1,4-alpha-glucosidase